MFWKNVRCIRHGFHSTCNDNIMIASQNRLSSKHDRFHAWCTNLVDWSARNMIWQTSKQCSLTCGILTDTGRQDMTQNDLFDQIFWNASSFNSSYPNSCWMNSFILTSVKMSKFDKLPLMTNAPNCGAENEANEPPKLPMGVLTAETTYTFWFPGISLWQSYLANSIEKSDLFMQGGMFCVKFQPEIVCGHHIHLWNELFPIGCKFS